MVHEDASHHLGRDAEEVCAILPLHGALVYQAHVSLVNQSGCLQCVTGLFTSQVTRGLAAQFLVNDRHQLVERLFVAATIANEQLRDVL
jgi:hypothetical protein